MAFCQQTLDFLVENRLENSKEWHAAHKADYNRYVLEPLQQLVERLAPAMLKIDSEFITEPRIDRTISRIFRDTRFSKDKSIYRDNCWITFMREKKLYMGYPAFWFDINPNGFGYGMGYYQAPPESMERLREAAKAGTPDFKAAWDSYKNQSLFSLEGEKYKKTRNPDHPEELRELLDRKSVSFNRLSADFKLLFSDELADTLQSGYEILAPMYRLLRDTR